MTGDVCKQGKYTSSCTMFASCLNKDKRLNGGQQNKTRLLRKKAISQKRNNKQK